MFLCVQKAFFHMGTFMFKLLVCLLKLMQNKKLGWNDALRMWFVWSVSWASWKSVWCHAPVSLLCVTVCLWASPGITFSQCHRLLIHLPCTCPFFRNFSSMNSFYNALTRPYTHRHEFVREISCIPLGTDILLRLHSCLII